ncbi:MAG: isoleucine--tRNA ligase, partial [Candidatus Hinthialibacter sp.]
AVHTAPGHGHEDYLVGMNYNLEVFSPVDEKGCFTEQSPVCVGQFVEKANQPIMDNLKERGLLVHQSELKHSYPHCWRSKKPIIFRATRQWFISLERQNLRDRLLKAIDKVNWIPSWGRQRIRGMVENRQEWCISRQRTWGVPIPAFYIGDSDQGILDADFIYELSKKVEQEGTDLWYRAIDDPGILGDIQRLQELLPEGKSLQDVRLDPDILDVWFDSGVSHHSVMAHDEKKYPVDMYLEGSDQHRGWFQSALVTATGAGYEPPYKTVLTHGFTVDEKGRKLSKSLGNFVVLDKLIKETGADVIRLWVAAEDFRGDMTFSQEILSRISESYRRIRNTARFLLGNISDFDLSQTVPEEERLELDRWILCRWRECKSRIIQAYDRFDFHRIFYDLNNFCSVDLSAMYLDIIKDRLYVSGKDSRDRKSGQSTIAEIAIELTACTAPILSFTCEEIWQLLREHNLVKEESVFLYELDKTIPGIDKQFMEKWDKIFLLRSEAVKAIEQARKSSIIGHSLDSCVYLKSANGEWQPCLEQATSAALGDDLSSILIVSDVKIGDLPKESAPYTSPLLPGVEIAVGKADGEK